MKIILLAVGKRHDAALAGAVEDYMGRLQKYAPVSWQLVPSPHASMSAAEQKTRETTALLAVLKSDDFVVLLDETGKQLTSPALADLVSTSRPGRLVFIIGGAYGVAESLQQRANFVWSLSNLVFPHQLVRLILAEQLYRAFTITRGEKYHHE